MALLLTGILAFGLTACGIGDKTEQKTPETTAEVADETTKPQETEAAQATEAPEEEPVDDTEGDAASEYVKYYKSVLDTHYDAYKNQWSVKKFQKNKLSLLAAISSKGNPLKEFGYSFMDVDGDGSYELLFGTVSETEDIQKVVFEMYTLKDGKPVQLFCSGERDRYYIGQEEEGAYIITNCGASSSTEIQWEYFILKGAKLSSVQKVIYSEEADEENPWFTEKIGEENKTDESHGRDIIESYEKRQIFPEYTSLELYKTE